jgi:hypothetical protein
MDFKYISSIENAPVFACWMTTRGGLAIWDSLMIGEDRSWTTAATTDGQPTSKPHSYAANKLDQVITDSDDVGPTTFTEVKRFHVGVRMGSQGLTLKLTDGATRKVRRAVNQAPEGSTYRFDYDTQEAVILAPSGTISLTSWMAKNPW